MENNALEREFDWEDEIENDGPEFTLLPEGDYDFTVTGFERERHPGSAKLPPCNKAVLNISIDSVEGRCMIRHNLFLHSKCEGLLCSFFTAIGQRKHGEKLRMNWAKVIGSTGRCRVGIREWINDKGEKRQINEIKWFCDPVEQPAPKFKEGDF